MIATSSLTTLSAMLPGAMAGKRSVTCGCAVLLAVVLIAPAIAATDDGELYVIASGDTVLMGSEIEYYDPLTGIASLTDAGINRWSGYAHQIAGVPKLSSLTGQQFVLEVSGDTLRWGHFTSGVSSRLHRGLTIYDSAIRPGDAEVCFCQAPLGTSKSCPLSLGELEAFLAYFRSRDKLRPSRSDSLETRSMAGMTCRHLQSARGADPWRPGPERLSAEYARAVRVARACLSALAVSDAEAGVALLSDAFSPGSDDVRPERNFDSRSYFEGAGDPDHRAFELGAGFRTSERHFQFPVCLMVGGFGQAKGCTVRDTLEVVLENGEWRVSRLPRLDRGDAADG